jgi:hypothetical protein
MPEARSVFVCLPALLLIACATSPPSSFYVLTPIPEAAASAADIEGGGVSIGIGPVVFPQFLDRPQLVTRDSANRLSLDEFHRWGGTVQDDFLRVWGENLTHLLGTSRVLAFPSESRMALDFRILAEVVSFEGIPGNAALLKVRWAVMDPYLEQTLAAREDVYRCPIEHRPQGSAPILGLSKDKGPGADSEAVVAAMSRCLGDFSRDVASVVRRLPKPPPPAATVSPI